RQGQGVRQLRVDGRARDLLRQPARQAGRRAHQRRRAHERQPGQVRARPQAGARVVIRLLAAAVALALVAAAPALASERHPSQAEIEGEVMCPVCGTTLDQSHSAIAQRMKAYIARRRQAGATKSQVETELVGQFGTRILAAPPKHGFDLLAWLLPLGGVVLGGAALGAAAWRWSRAREPQPAVVSPSSNGRVALEPELEQRLDEELARFD